MSRSRLTLLTVLAVLTVGATASASASAHEWIACEEQVANTFNYSSLANCFANVGGGGKWERLALPVKS